MGFCSLVVGQCWHCVAQCSKIASCSLRRGGCARACEQASSGEHQSPTESQGAPESSGVSPEILGDRWRASDSPREQWRAR
eukprot:13982337-Alexandrium_andersonii.AAC.1